jgi:DNA-binding NarL/FixJ family response regulator
MSVVPVPIKVLAVDGHALLREGIAAVVNAESETGTVARIRTSARTGLQFAPDAQILLSRS